MLIYEGSWGGKADSKFSGIEGSFAEAVGIDGHSTPGLLKVSQKFTKNSGTTVTELCKVAIVCSNGYHFWFSSSSGNIWARKSDGTWSLAYTTVPAGGSTAGCSGAMELNGYIYWATARNLHRISITNADDSWASAEPNWQTFDIKDADFHPMAVQYSLTGRHLFIGDGNQIAEVNALGTFNSKVLDLNTPYRVKTMIPYDIDLLIGTYITNDINKTEIIRWDTIATSWNTSDPIEEVGINAFIRDDNYVYANAGKAGNIYYYDGEKLLPFKKIPGEYSSSAYGEIYPNSVANYQGIPIFGFSNGSGNPAKQGIYRLGSYSRDYRKVLDLSYVISQNKVADIEIGAILVAGSDIYVSWKDGTNYGIDKIDYSNKYTSAYLETMMLFQGDREKVKTLQKISAYYNSLPASTGIVFSYSINGASYVEMTPITNTLLNEIYSKLSIGEIGSIQFKIAFTVSANNAPTVEAIGCEFS